MGVKYFQTVTWLKNTFLNFLDDGHQMFDTEFIKNLKINTEYMFCFYSIPRRIWF